jgi:hypothetical protein
MITGVVQDAAGRGKKLIFLGLSRENVNRLIAGQPILITEPRTAALGLENADIIVHFGETEDEILEEIKGYPITIVERDQT